MIKYLCILIFSLVVKNRAFLTTNADVEATARNNPVLMRLLQTVDAATTDERLLDVSLQLLKSLCICMRDTLKEKQLESAYFNGDTNSLQAEDNITNPSRRVMEIYQNIYNKTCIDLKNEVASKVNKSAKISSDEEKEFMLKSVCGKKPMHTIINIHDTQKQDATMTKNDTTLEDILYQTFVKTRNYHRFRARKYSLYKQTKQQTRASDEHSVIVILTLYPENNTSHSINNCTKLIDELNKTLHTHSPIDIDIIDARYGQKENISEEILTSKEATDCALKSIYIFLLQSEKHNKTKVFKVLHRNNSIKVYIDVTSEPYHSDYTKMCCTNKTDIPLCKIEFTNEIFESKEITTTPHKKEKSEHFKDTISKIKCLVKLYDKKLIKKKLKRSTTLQTFIKQNEIKSYVVTEGDNDKYAEKNETGNAFTESNSLLNYIGSKEVWMNRIFNDESNHKEDKNLRTVMAQITQPDQKYTGLLKKNYIKSNLLTKDLIYPHEIDSKLVTSTELLNLQKIKKYKANDSHHNTSISQTNETSDLLHLQSGNSTERSLSGWEQANNTFSTLPNIEKVSDVVLKNINSAHSTAQRDITSSIAQLPIENTLEIIVTTNNKQKKITINDLFSEPNINEVNKNLPTINKVTTNNNGKVSKISENSTSKEIFFSICISLSKNTRHPEFSDGQSALTNNLLTSSFHIDDSMKAKDVDYMSTTTNTEKKSKENNMTESPTTINVFDIRSQGDKVIEQSTKYSLEVHTRNLSSKTTEVFRTMKSESYYDLNLFTSNVLDTTHSYNADVISDLTGSERHDSYSYNTHGETFAGNRFTNNDSTGFTTFNNSKPKDETTTSEISHIFSVLTDPFYFKNIYTLTDSSTSVMNKSSLMINNPTDKERNYTVFNQSRLSDYTGNREDEANNASINIETTPSQTFENRSNVTQEIFRKENNTNNYTKDSNKIETEQNMAVINQLYSTLPDNVGSLDWIQMEEETNNLMTMRNVPKTALNQERIKFARTLKPALLNKSDNTTISNFINSKVYDSTFTAFASQATGTDENNFFFKDFIIMNQSKNNPLKKKDELSDLKTPNNSMLYKVNASGTTEAKTNNDLIIKSMLSKIKENIESDSYSTILPKYTRSTEPMGTNYFWPNIVENSDLFNTVTESNMKSQEIKLNYSFPSSTKKIEYLLTTQDTINHANQKEDKTNANKGSPTIKVPDVINIATNLTTVSPKNVNIISISPDNGYNTTKSVSDNSDYISYNNNISTEKTLNTVTNNRWHPIMSVTQSKYDSSFEVLKYSQTNDTNPNLNETFNNISDTTNQFHSNQNGTEADLSNDAIFGFLNINTGRTLMMTTTQMSNGSDTRDLKYTDMLTIKVSNKSTLNESNFNNILFGEINNTNDINKSTFIHDIDYYSSAFDGSQKTTQKVTPKISVYKNITGTRLSKKILNLANYSSIESKTSVDKATKASVPDFSLTDTFESTSKTYKTFTQISNKTNQYLNNNFGDETIQPEGSVTGIIKTDKYWALTKVHITNDSKIEGIKDPTISDISFSDTTQRYKLSHTENLAINNIVQKNKTDKNSIHNDDKSIKNEKNQDQKKSTFVTDLDSYYTQYDKSEEITQNDNFNILDLNTTVAILDGDNYYSTTPNSVTEAITTIWIGNKTSTLLLNDASILNKKNENISYTMNQYSSGEKTMLSKDIDFNMLEITKVRNPTTIINLIHNVTSIGSPQHTDVLNVNSLYTTKPYSYSMNKINAGTNYFPTERHIDKKKWDLFDGNSKKHEESKLNNHKPYLYKQNSKTVNNYSDIMAITTAAKSVHNSKVTTVKHSLANEFILNTTPTSQVTNQHLVSEIENDFFQPKEVFSDIFEINEARIQASKATQNIYNSTNETLRPTEVANINSRSTLNLSIFGESSTEDINILQSNDKIVNNTGNLNEINLSPEVTQNTTKPVLAINQYSDLSKEILDTTKPYTSNNDNFSKGQHDVGDLTLSDTETLTNITHNVNDSRAINLTYSFTEIFDKVSPELNKLFNVSSTLILSTESNSNFSKYSSTDRNDTITVTPFINKIYSTLHADDHFGHSTSIAKDNNVLILDKDKYSSNLYNISKNLSYKSHLKKDNTTNMEITSTVDNLIYPEIKEDDTESSNMPVTSNFLIVFKSNNKIKHNSKNESDFNNLKENISNFTKSFFVTRNDMYSTFDAHDDFAHSTMIAKNNNESITYTDQYTLSDAINYNVNQYNNTSKPSYTTQPNLSENKTNSMELTGRGYNLKIPYYEEDNIESSNPSVIVNKDKTDNMEITGTVDNLNTHEIKEDGIESSKIVTKNFSIVFKSHNKIKYKSKDANRINNIKDNSSNITKSHSVTRNDIYSTLNADDNFTRSILISKNNNVTIIDTDKNYLSDSTNYNLNQFNITTNPSFTTQPNLNENKTNSIDITGKVDHFNIPYYREDKILAVTVIPFTNHIYSTLDADEGFAHSTTIGKYNNVVILDKDKYFSSDTNDDISNLDNISKNISYTTKSHLSKDNTNKIEITGAINNLNSPQIKEDYTESSSIPVTKSDSLLFKSNNKIKHKSKEETEINNSIEINSNFTKSYLVTPNYMYSTLKANDDFSHSKIIAKNNNVSITGTGKYSSSDYIPYNLYQYDITTNLSYTTQPNLNENKTNNIEITSKVDNLNISHYQENILAVTVIPLTNNIYSILDTDEDLAHSATIGKDNNVLTLDKNKYFSSDSNDTTPNLDNITKNLSYITNSHINKNSTDKTEITGAIDTLNSSEIKEDYTESSNIPLTKSDFLVFKTNNKIKHKSKEEKVFENVIENSSKFTQSNLFTRIDMNSILKDDDDFAYPTTIAIDNNVSITDTYKYSLSDVIDYNLNQYNITKDLSYTTQPNLKENQTNNMEITSKVDNLNISDYRGADVESRNFPVTKSDLIVSSKTNHDIKYDKDSSNLKENISNLTKSHSSIQNVTVTVIPLTNYISSTRNVDDKFTRSKSIADTKFSSHSTEIHANQFNITQKLSYTTQSYRSINNTKSMEITSAVDNLIYSEFKDSKSSITPKTLHDLIVSSSISDIKPIKVTFSDQFILPVVFDKHLKNDNISYSTKPFLNSDFKTTATIPLQDDKVDVNVLNTYKKNTQTTLLPLIHDSKENAKKYTSTKVLESHFKKHDQDKISFVTESFSYRQTKDTTSESQIQLRFNTSKFQEANSIKREPFKCSTRFTDLSVPNMIGKIKKMLKDKRKTNSSSNKILNFTFSGAFDIHFQNPNFKHQIYNTTTVPTMPTKPNISTPNQNRASNMLGIENVSDVTSTYPDKPFLYNLVENRTENITTLITADTLKNSGSEKPTHNSNVTDSKVIYIFKNTVNTTSNIIEPSYMNTLSVKALVDFGNETHVRKPYLNHKIINRLNIDKYDALVTENVLPKFMQSVHVFKLNPYTTHSHYTHTNVFNETLTIKSLFLTTPHTSAKIKNETNSSFASVTDSIPMIITSNNTRFTSEVNNSSLEPPYTEVYDITSQFHDQLTEIQMPAVTYDNDSGMYIKKSSFPKSSTTATYTTNKTKNYLYDNITSNIIKKLKVASDIVDIQKSSNKPLNTSRAKINKKSTTKTNVYKAVLEDIYFNNTKKLPTNVFSKNKMKYKKVLAQTQIGLGGSSMLNKAKEIINNNTNKNNLTKINFHRLKPVSVHGTQKLSFNHQSPYTKTLKKTNHSLMTTISVIKRTDSLQNNIKVNKVSTTRNNFSNSKLPQHFFDSMYQSTQSYYLNPRNYNTNDTKTPSKMSGNGSRNRDTNLNYATTDIVKPFFTDTFSDSRSFDTKPYGYNPTINDENYKNIVKMNTFSTIDNDSHKYLLLSTSQYNFTPNESKTKDLQPQYKPQNKDIELMELVATTTQFTNHVTQSRISLKADDINVSRSKQQYDKEKMKTIIENNKETPMERYLDSTFTKENKNNSVTGIPFNSAIFEDIFTKSEMMNTNEFNLDNMIKTNPFNTTTVKINDPLNSTSSLSSVSKTQDDNSAHLYKPTNNIIQEPRNIPVYTAIGNVFGHEISQFDNETSVNILPYNYTDNYSTSIHEKGNLFYGHIGRKPNNSFTWKFHTTKSFDSTSNINVFGSKKNTGLIKPIGTSSHSAFDIYKLYPKSTLYTSAKMTEKNKNFYNMTTMTMPNLSKFTDSRTSISTSKMPYFYGQDYYNLTSLESNMSNVLNSTTTTTTTGKNIFKDILVKNKKSKPIMDNIIRDLGQSTKFEFTNANSTKHILTKTDILRKVKDSVNTIIKNSRGMLLNISKESTKIANATKKFVKNTRNTITPENSGVTYQTLINTRRQQHRNMTTSIEPMTILKNSKNLADNKETWTIINDFHNQFKNSIFNDLHKKTIFITKRIMKNSKTEREPEKIVKSKIISRTNLSKFINVIKVPTLYTNGKFRQLNGNEKTFVNSNKSNQTIHPKQITRSRQSNTRRASVDLESLPRHSDKIAKISNLKQQTTKSIVYNTYKALTEEELTLPPDVKKIITSFSTIYTKEINNMTSLVSVNSNKHQVNKIRSDLKPKLPLTEKLNKIKETNNEFDDALIYDTLHSFTNNTYLHPIEIFLKDTQRKLLKRVNMNKNSPIVMMNTDNFLSFHQTVTRKDNFYKMLKPNPLPAARYQIKAPRVTKMAKRIMLKPRFNSLEVSKTNPIPAIPKQIVMQDDRDFYRDNFQFHHKPDQSWREKISEVRTKLEPQRRSGLQSPQKINFEPVIDVPYYMPTHMKSYFLRDKVDSVRSFIYNEEKNQLNSRRHFKSPLKIENSGVAVDAVDPYEHMNLSVDKSHEQTEATSPRVTRPKKTIFFLSPTVPYKRYF